MRRSPMRLAAVLLLAPAALLAACGSATLDPEGAGDDPARGSAAGAEVVGQGMVMQSSPGADPELCMGAVAMSYPPQCGGPTLAGLFSWDDVEAESQGGVRWSNGNYYGVGHYDRASDTFTLTRPLSSSAPEGLPEPEDDSRDFPQVCDDPFRGGDEGYADPDFAIQNAFQEQLEELPGYVESWVSDGQRMFNVIVTGDAEEAHATLREIWPGGLCVESRSAPTAADIEAATRALGEHSDELGLLSWGGHGQMFVQVVLADEATTTRIHEIISPWLTPEQVQISGAFQPLPQP